jgi:hypothetical protein
MILVSVCGNAKFDLALRWHCTEFYGRPVKWETDNAQINQVIRCRENLPIDSTVIFPFASESTTQLDACPDTCLSVDLAKKFQGSFKSKRFDPNIVSNVESSAVSTGSSPRNIRMAAGRTYSCRCFRPLRSCARERSAS